MLCHDPSRRTIDEHPDFPIPDLRVAIDDYLRAGRLTNRAIRCVGLSINSSSLSDTDCAEYFRRLTVELGLPVCDPVRTGVDVLADALVASSRPQARIGARCGMGGRHLRGYGKK